MSDADAMFHNWASDPEVVKFLPYDAHVSIEDSRNQMAEWIRDLDKVSSGSWEIFAIELKSTGETIGTIDFHETDREAKSAEVGYQLGRAWWGNGYMAEALRALFTYCFETVGFNRVWATYDSRNPGSGRVMQKAGMLYEGTLRQCKFRKGELVDRLYYAILAEDYFGAKESPNEKQQK